MDLGNRLLDKRLVWVPNAHMRMVPSKKPGVAFMGRRYFDGKLHDAESNRRTPWCLNLLPLYLLQLYLVYRQTRQHIL